MADHRKCEWKSTKQESCFKSIFTEREIINGQKYTTESCHGLPMLNTAQKKGF